MCYLTLPTEIYADAAQLEIYKDTDTTLSGGPGVVVDEVHTIDLDGFSMTQIESPGEQCPQPTLSISSSGDYDSSKVAINSSNDLEVTFDHTIEVKSYTVTV